MPSAQSWSRTSYRTAQKFYTELSRRYRRRIVLERQKFVIQTATKAKMNLSAGHNTAFVGNRCDLNDTRHQPSNGCPGIYVLAGIIFYVIITLGIPGNVLSAVIWLRRHVASKNSSINDLIYLPRMIVRHYVPEGSHRQLVWLWRGLGESARILEPLLVLTFTVERLYAILRPLQVN